MIVFAVNYFAAEYVYNFINTFCADNNYPNNMLQKKPQQVQMLRFDVVFKTILWENK